MAILLSIKNNSYRRILSAQACSGTEISPYAILKLQSGATTLKNHFSSKIFLAFQRIFRVTGTVRFSSENIRVFQSNRKNSIFRTSAILESVINNHPIYGYISNKNFTADSKKFNFFESAYANFLKCDFLLNAWAKYFFDFRFGISVKFRVE